MKKKNRNLLRVTINIVLLASILFLPWWVSVAIMVFLLALYRAYEVFLWGFLMDALYSGPVPLYLNIPILFTIMSVLLFIVIGVSKQRLIFYTNN